MSLFGSIFVAMLASIGVALSMLEILRSYRARKTSFVCLCFREELIDGGMPDMLIICRTDCEQEEVIRRVCDGESRRVYIKRF